MPLSSQTHNFVPIIPRVWFSSIGQKQGLRMRQNMAPKGGPFSHFISQDLSPLPVRSTCAVVSEAVGQRWSMRELRWLVAHRRLGLSEEEEWEVAAIASSSAAGHPALKLCLQNVF